MSEKLEKFHWTPRAFFFFLIGLSVLLLAGGGGTLYLANSIMEEHSRKVVDLKLKNRVLDDQLVAYRNAEAELTRYKDLQDLVGSVVPPVKDQARVVRELVKLANDNNIEISAVNFPTSTLGTRAPTGTGTTPVAGSAAVPPLSQAKPVVGLTGVYTIQTSLTPLIDATHKVTYGQLLSFLNKLELNRRTMQITNLQITPKGIFQSDGIGFELTVNIFVKP